MCSEGRPLHDAMAMARLDIDDTHEDNNRQVRMFCLIPVFVYFRQSDLQADSSGHWTLEGHSVDREEGIISLEKWRERAVDMGLMCNSDTHPQMGAYYPHCSKLAWDCISGKCTAYEKSRRLCASEIRKDSYSCFYIPGDTTAGVEEAKVHYPLLWLIIAVVATVWFLQCGCLAVIAIKRDCQDHTLAADFALCANELYGSNGYLCGAKVWAVCIVTAFVIFAFIYAKFFRQPERPETPSGGMTTYRISDLSTEDLRAEMPVPTSFWTLQTGPSLSSQVVLLVIATLSTFLYQVCRCCRQEVVKCEPCEDQESEEDERGEYVGVALSSPCPSPARSGPATEDATDALMLSPMMLSPAGE